MAVSKKRIIKSLENLSEELKELLREQYPNGYETSINRIVNAKKEPIFVFPLETEDAIYLVKVPVTKNSDGGYDVESSEKEEFAKNEDGEAGGDNFDNTGGDDDDYDGASGGGDYDDDGDGKQGRESSYDPDFDN